MKKIDIVVKKIEIQTFKDVPVKEIKVHLGKPNPNCPVCKGTGNNRGIWCSCTFDNATFEEVKE